MHSHSKPIRAARVGIAMTSIPWKSMLITALAVAGCGGSEAADAEDAVETSSNTSTESALMDATVESSGATCALNPEALAAASIAKVKAAMSPQGCVAATQNGVQVSFAFDHCTGKYGLVTVTGNVDVTYALNADCSITAHGEGQGIQANKATLNLDATAVYSKDGSGLAKAVVTTHSTGTGARGMTFDHSGNYTVTHDMQGCFTLDGSWSTDWGSSRGSATTSTTARGLKRCADSCPAAGGSIVHHGFFSRVLTVTLDGSSTAKWTSSNGKSGTVDLKCE
jgi:hypothetical protein